ISKWYSNSPSQSVSVIIRFLGTTPSSSDISKPLSSIIEQICQLYQIQVSPSSAELKYQLEQLLTLIPKSEQLVLLLDSVDQLDVEQYDCTKWLPAIYPSNVKCVLSTIPTIEVNRQTYDILDGLRKLIGFEIEITELNEMLAIQTLYSWLKTDHRQLTPIQHEWIQQKILRTHTITPL
ncbi:unnamed protein product, partial [Didymodactylos carnosus]